MIEQVVREKLEQMNSHLELVKDVTSITKQRLASAYTNDIINVIDGWLIVEQELGSDKEVGVVGLGKILTFTSEDVTVRLNVAEILLYASATKGIEFDSDKMVNDILSKGGVAGEINSYATCLSETNLNIKLYAEAKHALIQEMSEVIKEVVREFQAHIDTLKVEEAA